MLCFFSYSFSTSWNPKNTGVFWFEKTTLFWEPFFTWKKIGSRDTKSLGILVATKPAESWSPQMDRIELVDLDGQGKLLPNKMSFS